MSESTPTLLVTGAAGHLGRRVIELLQATKAGKIIATTRAPARLADLAAQGVDVRQADFDQPAGLAAAFAGADRLLLISTDAVGVPGLRIAQHRAAIDAAVQAGVKHIVYTSITRAEPESPIAITPDHYQTEQALAATELDWTILRNNLYSELLLGSVPRAVATGKLVQAAGDGQVGYVTREDCARAAAAVLNSNRSGRNIFEITGPELVSYADIARMTSEIVGKPIEYVNVSPTVIVDGMVQAGLPRSVAEAMVTFDVGTAQGVLALVTNAVEELTGKTPQSVAEFLSAQREQLLSA